MSSLNQPCCESFTDFVADSAEAGEFFFFGAFGVSGVVERPVKSFDGPWESRTVVLGSLADADDQVRRRAFWRKKFVD